MSPLAELAITLFKFLGAEPDIFFLVLDLIGIGLSLLLICIAGLLILVGVGFIIWALYLYLAVFLSSHIAALVSGLITLLVSGVLVFVTRLVRAHRRSRTIIRLFSWLRNYPQESMLAALAAGFLVGVSPEVRKALAEGIAFLLKQAAPGGGSKDKSQGSPGESSKK